MTIKAPTLPREQQSEVHIHASGVTYAGPDAIRLVQARYLSMHLRLYARAGIRPTRTITPAVMLMLAEKITGTKYKRGAYLTAAADLDTWAATMQAALPITDTNESDE